MYLNIWSTQEEMLSDFDIDSSVLEGYNVLLASYDQGGYEGDAYVLLAKGDQLFAVRADHCSCYGLEGMWDPEPTTAEAEIHLFESSKKYYDIAGCTVFALSVLDKLVKR